MTVPTVESSWFMESLGEAASFIGRLLRQFVRLFSSGMLFTLVLALVVGYSGSNGLAWKGVLGGVIVIIGGTLIAFIVAAQLSTTFAAAETIRVKSAGQRILNALFAQLLGVTAEKPAGDGELTRRFHGLPVKEVESRLTEAGRSLLKEPIGTGGLSRFGGFFARRVRRVLIWAAVKVIVAYCASGKSGDENIDMLALRANLAREVDQLLVERLQQAAFRFMLLIALAATTAGWVLVKGLNLLPGS